MPPYPLLRNIDQAGLRLRIWCFACARGTEMDAGIWMRFHKRCWPEHLAGAATRFRCSGCRSAGDVVILPASQPKPPPLDPKYETMSASELWSSMVHQWFFSNKSKRLFVPDKPR